MSKIKHTFKNKLSAFIAIPLLVANLPVSFVGQASIVPSVTEAFQNSIFFEQSEESLLEAELNEQASKIDAYFKQWNLPLAGHGMAFAQAAHEYGLDPFLLPAIAMRETTGGKHMCKTDRGANNPFGYGSCKIAFDDLDHAIDIVAQAVSGVHPKIGYAYAGKDIEGILKTYNPPSVVATYAYEVMDIMEDIAFM